MNRIMLTKQENARYNSLRLHILQYPGICLLFILACICADAFTLFSVFDLILTQQKEITWVITITVASAINLAPMLLAANLRNEELTKGAKAVVCTFLACLFIILFVMTFSLRYASQELLYGSSSDLGILLQGEAIQNGAVTGEAFEPTAAQRILAIILGFEPCATSICSFVLSYEVSPKRKRRHLGNLQITNLEEEMDKCKVMLAAVKESMEFDLEEYDRNQYEAFRAVLIQQGELAKNTAIRKLTEHIKTPEAVSFLMEGEYMKDDKNAETADSASVPISMDVENRENVKNIA